MVVSGSDVVTSGQVSHVGQEVTSGSTVAISGQTGQELASVATSGHVSQVGQVTGSRYSAQEGHVGQVTGRGSGVSSSG